MNPIKRKEIVKLTSKELNLSEDLVDDVVCLLFKTAQTRMKSLEPEPIFIIGLGTFSLLCKTLRKKNLRYKEIVSSDVLQDATFSKYNYRQSMIEEIERQDNAIKYMADEYIVRGLFMKKKYGNNE